MEATTATQVRALRSPHGFRLFSAPVLGWAFYDFANTIFSFAVITRYFNEWVIEDRGRPDWNVSLMGFVVGLVLILVMPAMGAVSDQLGRRLPFLAAFTLLCIVATAVLGIVSSTVVALVVAGIAIFAFQLALSMYDPLLATVAPEEHRGTVSGLGVGLGYVGVLAGSLVLTAIVGDGDKQGAFLPTAIMFLLFSVPIFAFVRERSPRARLEHPLGRVVRDSLAQLRRTTRHIRAEHRHVGRFLLARFLYVDAIATVIAYMTVYMNRVGDFSASQKNLVLGLAMVAAALGGFIGGRIVERRGPKFVLQGILVLAVITLLVAAITGSAGLVWVLGPAVGITLGAVWTSDRVFMMRLTPPEVRGEFFGIYNLVGKLSSGVGPLVLWAGTIWVLHDHGSFDILQASRAALAMLALAVVAGLVVLRPLTDEIRYADQAWTEQDEHA
jgi:UMF1 family MFS transporter